MSENVAILSLMAKLKDNSRELAQDVKKQVEYAEKNAGNIQVKIDASQVRKEISDVANDIQKLRDGKLKGLDLSKQIGTIFDTFANPKKGPKAYLGALKNVRADLEELSQIPNVGLMKDFTSKQITSVLTKYRGINANKYDLQELEKSKRKEAEQIQAASIKALKQRLTRDKNEKYASASTDESIEKLAKKIGIENVNDAKDDIKQYSQLLAIFDNLVAKKEELSKIDTEEGLKKNIENNKTLLSVIKKINGFEDKLQSKYGIEFEFTKLDNFGANIVNKSIDDYVKKGTEKYKIGIKKQENDLMQYVIDIASRQSESISQKQKKEINKAQINLDKRKTKSGNGSSNSPDPSELSDSSNPTDPIKKVQDEAGDADESVNKLHRDIQNLGNDSEKSAKQIDEFSLSFDKLKSKYSDLEKYAVSSEEAINKFKELEKILNSRAFTDQEEIDYVGYGERISAMDLDLPTSDIDAYYDIADNYSDLSKKIHKMTAEQLDIISQQSLGQDSSIQPNVDDAEKSTGKLKTDMSEISESAQNANLGNLKKDSEEVKDNISSAKKDLEKMTAEERDEYQKQIEKQLALDDETGRFSELDTIIDYYDKFKNTNAYLKEENSLLEERAILIKKGQQIGEEFISSSETGKVSIGNAISEYKPDAVLHTHPYDANIDNLRFSDADIKELVDGTVKKAMLICGDEIATMDMTDVSPDKFQDLQNDILGAYTAVFARYGATIEDGKLVGIDTLPEDIQNQATDAINNIMKGILQQYNGDLLFDKFGIDESGLTYSYENDKNRLKKFSKNESEILNKFLGAVASDNPVENIKSLQKELGIIKEIKTESENAEQSIKKMQESSKDVADTKIENSAKDIKEIADQTLNDSAETASQEKNNFDDLSNSIDNVKDAISGKNELLSTELEIANNTVSSEISLFDSLSDAINKVSDAIKNKNDILSDNKIDSLDNSDQNQKEDNEKKDNSNNSDSSRKQRKRNTKYKEIESLPSSYIKNKNIAYDEAIKINNALNKTAALQNNISEKSDSTIVSKLSSDIDELNKKLTSGKISLSQYENNVDQLFDSFDKIDTSLQRAQTIISGTLSSTIAGSFPSVVQQVESNIESLNNQLKNGSITAKQYDRSIDNIATSLKNATNYADSYDDAMAKMKKRALEVAGSNAKFIDSGIYDKNGNLKGAKLTAIFDADGVSKKLTQTWDAINTKGISEVTSTTQKATSTIGTFFDGLRSKWGDVLKYFLTFGSIYQVFDVFKQGLNIIKDLDDALTEMQKVSDQSYESLKAYQKESFVMANEVGTTGEQIQQSTADFLRLGESFDQAKESAKAANILFNVSEFDSIDEATESLIAMSSAYKELDKMEINDKLNNIGNNYSIATDGLATALQKSASALTTAGNDIDEAIALITAGNAVVQDPDSVGAGVRTIALRLVGTEAAKAELEEIGEDTSDFIVQTASKINEEFKAFTAVQSNDFKGISILDENGNNRNTYEVLKDVAEIYSEIVETDKKFGTNHLNGLLELIAGKNRSNIAASIIQNKDILNSVYEDAKKSEGSAMEENQKYLDSISGHLDQLKNKWQEVWVDTANRDQVNFFVDLGKSILDVVDNIGLLQTALGAIGLLYGAKNAITGEGIFSTLFGWPKSRQQIMLCQLLSEPSIIKNYI